MKVLIKKGNDVVKVFEENNNKNYNKRNYRKKEQKVGVKILSSDGSVVNEFNQKEFTNTYNDKANNKNNNNNYRKNKNNYNENNNNQKFNTKSKFVVEEVPTTEEQNIVLNQTEEIKEEVVVEETSIIEDETLVEVEESVEEENYDDQEVIVNDDLQSDIDYYESMYGEDDDYSHKKMKKRIYDEY